MNTEQKQIVARVKELPQWRDTIKLQWHQTRTLGAHLLNSILQQLLS